MASSNFQRVQKLSGLVVLVVDDPRHVRLGHPNASKLQSARNRHGWKDLEWNALPVYLSNPGGDSSRRFAERGQLCSGFQNIVVALIGR